MGIKEPSGCTLIHDEETGIHALMVQGEPAGRIQGEPASCLGVHHSRETG